MGSMYQWVIVIALLVYHTGGLNGKCAQEVTVIAILVLQTGELGKCWPICDCYSYSSIANRGTWEVLADM